MQKFISIYQQIIGELHYLAYLLLVVTLPFPWQMTQKFYAAWLIGWFLEFRWLQRSKFRFNQTQIPLVFIVFFIVLEAISLLWTQDLDAGAREMQRHVPLCLVFVVTLFGIGENYKSHQVKTVLVFGCLLSILCYGMVVYQHFRTNTLFVNGTPFWQCTVWTLLGDGPIGLIKHRNHYCIVLLISLFFTPDLARYYRTKYPAIYVNTAIGLIDVVLVFTIILTGSRSGMFLLPIILVLMLFTDYVGRHKRLWATAIIAVCVLLLGMGLKYNGRLITMKSDISRIVSDEGVEVTTLHEPRLSIFSCIWHHRHDYGLKGVGLGASSKVLREFYAQDGFDMLVLSGFGTHSYYFSIWMEMGPIALLALIFILVSAPFFHTKGHIRKTAICVCLVYAWCMLTETVLSQMANIYTLSTLIALIQLEEQRKRALSLPDARL